MIGGWEIVLILAIVLILFGSKYPPKLARGLRRGIDEFGKASRELADELDQGAADAGRSLGGIYGKPAAEALTPDSHVAELYDPAAFGNRPAKRGLFHRAFAKLRACVLRIVRRFTRKITPKG